MTYKTFKQRMLLVLGIVGIAAIVSLVSIFIATTSELKLGLSFTALALDAVAAFILIPTIKKSRKGFQP